MDNVEQRLAEACARSGRERSEIELIAVTKYVGVEQTKSVLGPVSCILARTAGRTPQTSGRHYLAAAGRQSREPPAGQAIWHFIGSLQTNKVKDVIGKFTYIHSLDRLSLRRPLTECRAARHRRTLFHTSKCFRRRAASMALARKGLSSSRKRDCGDASYWASRSHDHGGD